MPSESCTLRHDRYFEACKVRMMTSRSCTFPFLLTSLSCRIHVNIGERPLDTRYHGISMGIRTVCSLACSSMNSDIVWSPSRRSNPRFEPAMRTRPNRNVARIPSASLPTLGRMSKRICPAIHGDRLCHRNLATQTHTWTSPRNSLCRQFEKHPWSLLSGGSRYDLSQRPHRI